MTAYQLMDELNATGEGARYVTFAADQRFYLGQFVIITCPASGRMFFGDVTSPALNIGRGVLSPTDATTFNQIELIADAKMDRNVAVNELWISNIRFLADVTGEAIRSVTLRPLTTAMGRGATADEVARFINLPPSSHPLGSIINSDIPICLTSQLSFKHVLLAGCTGSGKSNTAGNLIVSSVEQGGCVVILDHKPDYQHCHLPNSEHRFGKGLKDVKYYTISDDVDIFDNDEAPLSVPFNQLEPEVLAATVFHRHNEELQREAAEELIHHYLDDNPIGTKDGFINWLPAAANAAPIPVDNRTYSSIYAKVRRRGRWPHWIDAVLGSRIGKLFGAPAIPVAGFDLATLIKPGRTIVIRIGRMNDGRSYALLLGYVLSTISLLKATKQVVCPVSVLVDEAQDIFSASRQFRAIAEKMFDDNIRKARSLGIGFIVAVQAAEEIPDKIINNLLNRIIHQHTSPDQIKTAASMASEAQRQMTNSFGPGEALVSICGARSIVHAQMNLSPFKLTKFDT